MKLRMKNCNAPNCHLNGKWTKGKCPTHQREYDKRRGTRAQRGYDAAYDRERKAWQARLDHGERLTCWRCGNPIDPAAWHLGHDDHDRTIIHGPECPPCNLSAAGRISHMR